jgi:hypothetical protein
MRRGVAGSARYGESLIAYSPISSRCKLHIHRKDARNRCHIMCRYGEVTDTTSEMWSDSQ